MRQTWGWQRRKYTSWQNFVIFGVTSELYFEHFSEAFFVYIKNYLFNWLVFFFFSHCTQLYFTYSTVASNMVGGNRAVPRGNQQPSTVCFSFTGREEVSITWTWTRSNCIGESEMPGSLQKTENTSFFDEKEGTLHHVYFYIIFTINSEFHSKNFPDAFFWYQ